LKEAQEMPYPDAVTELLFYDDLKKLQRRKKIGKSSTGSTSFFRLPVKKQTMKM
jgi:hypothetical protein